MVYTWRGRSIPYVFMLPFFVLFLFFFILPFAYSIYLSFFVNRTGSNFYVGLLNYRNVLTDANFWNGFGRVAYFGVVQVISMLVLALVLALILDSPYVKGKTFFRLVYFLPYAVPGVIAALMWGFLYSPELNPVLGVLDVFSGGKQFQILSPEHVLYGIVNMVTWEWTGYNMTIYFANLTSIPVELYEAAKIDGCSEGQLAWYIKLPLLRPTIVLTSILSIIGSLQLFNEPFILSSLTTIPYDFTPNMDIYTTGFSYNNLNYSAAMSTVLGIITFGAATLFTYFTSGEQRQVKRRMKQAQRLRPISGGGQYTVQKGGTV